VTQLPKTWVTLLCRTASSQQHDQGNNSVKRPNRACPLCGAPLEPKAIVAAGSFRCPRCHGRLQASESYAQLIGWGTLAVIALARAALGLRGLRLVLAVLVLFVPTLYLSVNFAKYLFPPRLETYLPKDATLYLRDGPLR